jgi:hypothetical protein
MSFLAHQLHVSTWKKHEDGRLWLGIYLIRALMLVAMAVMSMLVGAPPVAVFLALVVIPFNAIAMRFHRRRGVAHSLLPLGQIFAGLCAVISPKVVLGTIVCILVDSVTSTLGLPVRRVQAYAGVGAGLLLVGAIVYHESTVAAFALVVFGSACALANVISYLNNKRIATGERFENLLDGMHAYVHEANLDTGEILYLNKQIVELTGPMVQISEMAKFVHPEDLSIVQRAYARGSCMLNNEARLRSGAAASVNEA